MLNYQKGKTAFFFSLSDEDMVFGCFEKYFRNESWDIPGFSPPYKSNSLERQEGCISVMDPSASVCLL